MSGVEKVRIVIPQGVSANEILKISGKGEAGKLGSATGDLYVKVHVKKHSYFRREGDDIYINLPISFPQAALGAKIDVKTLDGSVILTVPSGIDSGALLRIRGKGMPHLYGGGRGDQYVEVELKTPKKLTKRQKELLDTLQGEGL